MDEIEVDGVRYRYTVVCQGKVDDRDRVVCAGWGRYGQPGERCPVCGQRVKVLGTIAIRSLASPSRPGLFGAPAEAIRLVGEVSPS